MELVIIIGTKVQIIWYCLIFREISTRVPRRMSLPTRKREWVIAQYGHPAHHGQSTRWRDSTGRQQPHLLLHPSKRGQRATSPNKCILSEKYEEQPPIRDRDWRGKGGIPYRRRQHRKQQQPQNSPLQHRRWDAPSVVRANQYSWWRAGWNRSTDGATRVKKAQDFSLNLTNFPTKRRRVFENFFLPKAWLLSARPSRYTFSCWV